MNYVKTTAKINDGYDEHAIYRLFNVHYFILLSTTEEYRSKEKLQNALLTMAENNRLSMRNNYRTLSCLMYIFIMFMYNIFNHVVYNVNSLDKHFYQYVSVTVFINLFFYGASLHVFCY